MSITINKHVIITLAAGTRHTLCCLFWDTGIAESYFYKCVSKNLNQQKQYHQTIVILLSNCTNISGGLDISSIFFFSFADDKYSLSLTKGSAPTRQARDRISTSSSIRDRSALYLSRAAAIDSTGGSTQPVSSWNASHSSPHAGVKGFNREWPLCTDTIGATQNFTINLLHTLNV